MLIVDVMANERGCIEADWQRDHGSPGIRATEYLIEGVKTGGRSEIRGLGRIGCEQTRSYRREAQCGFPVVAFGESGWKKPDTPLIFEHVGHQQFPRNRAILGKSWPGRVPTYWPWRQQRRSVAAGGVLGQAPQSLGDPSSQSHVVYAKEESDAQCLSIVGTSRARAVIAPRRLVICLVVWHTGSHGARSFGPVQIISSEPCGECPPSIL